MSVVLKVENVSKEYRLGVINRRMLYEELNTWWARVRGRPDPYTVVGQRIHKAVGGNRIWALDGVSFDVEQGETVGIIGHNGSGKSTLLKILSEITSPTNGRVLLKGKVASLLEVGTGFHAELTGRDNIFLSGAILGMKAPEIRRKLTNIIDFSGVGEFIDTPVKRYSSGMYMRLAFAVAAHLDPEILIIDEVLAVGDAEFQKKCLGKMDELAKGGRTVLFVSHNMTAISHLCRKVVTLNGGKVDYIGDADPAIRRYLDVRNQQASAPLSERTDRQGNKAILFQRILFFDAQGEPVTQLISGCDYTIRFYYAAEKVGKGRVLIAFNVKTANEHIVTNLNSSDAGAESMSISAEGYFQCEWKRFNLRGGTYQCNLFCSVDGEVADWIESAFALNVEDGDFYHTGRLVSRDQGDILVAHSWASFAGQSN